MEKFGPKWVYSNTTSIGRNLLQIIVTDYLKSVVFITFITETMWVLHVYPLWSPIVSCLLCDIPRSACLPAISLKKYKHTLLLFCWKKNPNSQLLLQNSAKSVQHTQSSLHLNLWWKQISGLESWRRECYPFTTVAVAISFCLPLLTRR